MAAVDVTQAFNRAYTEHWAGMLIAATGILRDPVAAEDVVQDVFLHLWRSPEAFDPARGSLRSYLTMMTRSRALDRWRSRRACDSALRRALQEARLERPATEDPSEAAIRRDGHRRALRAVETLPGDQRKAVLLAFGKGLTVREIAAAAQVPIGTAKSRLRVGLQKARADLAPAA